MPTGASSAWKCRSTGLKMVYEPKVLRFFTALFEPLPVPQHSARQEVAQA